MRRSAGTLPFLEREGVGLMLAPYVFGAAGELFLQNPTALERGHIRAASYGAGLRIGGGQVVTLSNGSLLLEFARQARSDGRQPLQSRLVHPVLSGCRCPK